uniref:3-dehydrosphinganine reductase TSC10A-like n=1 Tax=Tanacetum cinerariifolium TaxID=118510 RepID=A0A699HNM4_TANCI|nr:3-dehydrosphinganine reductase TSC10A-like [Tanacetum cinerariifolium]
MGPIDVLVCNQGVFVSQELEKQEINEDKGIIDVNLVRTFNVVKAALPGIKNWSDRKPISIVFMSSQAGQQGQRGIRIVVAEKHKVIRSSWSTILLHHGTSQGAAK